MSSPSGKPVLLVQGFGLFEPSDCFISKTLKEVCQQNKIPFKCVSGSQKSAAAIAEAHEKYRAIVFVDMS